MQYPLLSSKDMDKKIQAAAAKSFHIIYVCTKCRFLPE